MGASHSTSQEDPRPETREENDELTRVQPYGVSKATKHIALSSSYRTLYDGIVGLVQSNKYADLVIICGDDQYPVHRAIVCPRSSFFADYCDVVDGEVDYASPGKPTKIWIDPFECESHILAAVLTFLYTLDYVASGPQALTFGLPQEKQEGENTDEEDDETLRSVLKLDLGDNECDASDDGMESTATDIPTPSRTLSIESEMSTPDPSEATNELVFHAQVYLAAQKFHIVSLSEIAQDKFDKRLRSGHWNVEMIPCIREVYRHGNSPMLGALRNDIVKFAHSRFHVLKRSESWNDLVLGFPEFAAELLKRM